jgi:hypothetical protein
MMAPLDTGEVVSIARSFRHAAPVSALVTQPASFAILPIIPEFSSTILLVTMIFSC